MTRIGRRGGMTAQNAGTNMNYEIQNIFLVHTKIVNEFINFMSIGHSIIGGNQEREEEILPILFTEREVFAGQVNPIFRKTRYLIGRHDILFMNSAKMTLRK
jgi:hypothetical protein